MERSKKKSPDSRTAIQCPKTGRLLWSDTGERLTAEEIWQLNHAKYLTTLDEFLEKEISDQCRLIQTNSVYNRGFVDGLIRAQVWIGHWRMAQNHKPIPPPAELFDPYKAQAEENLVLDLERDYHWDKPDNWG